MNLLGIKESPLIGALIGARGVSTFNDESDDFLSAWSLSIRVSRCSEAGDVVPGCEPPFVLVRVNVRPSLARARALAALAIPPNKRRAGKPRLGV